MENKRILSTVTLIIFLTFLCFLCWFAIFTGVGIKEALADSEPVSTGDGTSDLILNAAVVITMGVGLILVMAASGIDIIISLICLGFSIRNTRVQYKPVKIINIILSCCFAAAAASGAIALILLRVL